MAKDNNQNALKKSHDTLEWWSRRFKKGDWMVHEMDVPLRLAIIFRRVLLLGWKPAFQRLPGHPIAGQSALAAPTNPHDALFPIRLVNSHHERTTRDRVQNQPPPMLVVRLDDKAAKP